MANENTDPMRKPIEDTFKENDETVKTPHNLNSTMVDLMSQTPRAYGQQVGFNFVLKGTSQGRGICRRLIIKPFKKYHSKVNFYVKYCFLGFELSKPKNCILFVNFTLKGTFWKKKLIFSL